MFIYLYVCVGMEVAMEIKSLLQSLYDMMEKARGYQRLWYICLIIMAPIY